MSNGYPASVDHEKAVHDTTAATSNQVLDEQSIRGAVRREGTTSIPVSPAQLPQNVAKDAQSTQETPQTQDSPRKFQGISASHNPLLLYVTLIIEDFADRLILQWFLVVLSTLSSILLYAFDNTITADVIPIVVSRFGNSNKLTWLSLGFTIGSVATVVPFSKLYGLFNAKAVYIGSVTLFVIGSALCGAAPNIDAFIVGRVIAGVGGNGMYLGVLTLHSVNTTDKERPMYLGLCGLTFGIGMVLGPVIGGAFAQSRATWRWSFYLNLCVGGLFAPIYIFILPGFDPRGSQKLQSRIREFDYLGAILIIATVVCIVMAIDFGGTLYAWKSGQVIALFVLSGALLVCFSLQQAFTFLTEASYRMFPVSFLKNKEAVLLFALMILCNAGGFIPVYWIPTYFQFTRGDMPLGSAVRLLPLIVMISGTVLVNGVLMAKYGYYQPWYVVGSALALVGGALFSTITVTTPTANIYGYEILLGIGAGAYAQAGYAVIQSVVDPSMMADGIGFIMLAQQAGITLGLSTAGAVFLNQAVKNLQQLIPGITGAELETAVLGVSGNFLSTLPPTTKEAALDVIVEALKKIFIVAYVCFAVGLVASCFLSRRKLHST